MIMHDKKHCRSGDNLFRGTIIAVTSRDYAKP